MKHFTERDIERFLSQRFDLQVREKQPFPGQFPTRVYMKAKGFEYLGKPSYRAYVGMRQAIREDYYRYATVEFDRGGPIYCTYRTGPNSRQIARWNEQLWQAYHPHQNADYCLSWMGYNFRLGKAGWYVVGAKEEAA